MLHFDNFKANIKHNLFTQFYWPDLSTMVQESLLNNKNEPATIKPKKSLHFKKQISIYYLQYFAIFYISCQYGPKIHQNYPQNAKRPPRAKKVLFGLGPKNT